MATNLLASVRDVAEALLAAEGGADIIDCKDPTQGALGALSPALVEQVRRRLPAEIPVSATVGDLPCHPRLVATAVEAIAATGVEYVKVGLFPGGDPLTTIMELGRLDLGRARLVGVLIADRALDLALVPAMARAGFAAVMLDTADKAAPALPELVNRSVLVDCIARGHAFGLRVGLAGSLRLRHIPGLLALGPDILGFRGLLCHMGARCGTLDPVALARVRAAVPQPGRLEKSSDAVVKERAL